MGRRDNVVSIGTDGQAPYFTMMSLKNKSQKSNVKKPLNRCVILCFCIDRGLKKYFACIIHFDCKSNLCCLLTVFCSYRTFSPKVNNRLHFHLVTKSTRSSLTHMHIEKKSVLNIITSRVWMCSNLSASHCLIFLSFPAVKNRWVLGTNWRNITLGKKEGKY